MSTAGTRIAAAAIAALALAPVFAASISTIPENGTITVGGSGADEINKRGNFIVFTPGSTLVVTQNGESLTIWATLVATNGAATISGPAGKTMQLQCHIFAYGGGSLTLEGVSTANIGHDTYMPVVKLDNLRLGSGVSKVTLRSLTALSFPTDSSVWQLGSDSAQYVRLCGDADMFPGQDTITVNRCSLVLCNRAALPSGRTVNVSNGRTFAVSPLTVPDISNGVQLDDYQSKDVAISYEGLTNSVNVVFATASSKLLFTNETAVAFNGAISGPGIVRLSGRYGGSASGVGEVSLGGGNSGFTGRIEASTRFASLRLAGESAAANATIKTDPAMEVRGEDGVAALQVGGVQAGAGMGSGRLLAAANQTVGVGTVSGILQVGGGEGSVVNIAAFAQDAILMDEGTATVNTPAAAAHAPMPGTEGTLIAAPGVCGLDSAALAGFTQITAFDVGDGMQACTGTNAVTLRAAAGVDVSLGPGGGTYSVAGEGSFSADAFILLKRTVDWWFDFSRADTVFKVGQGASEQWLNEMYNGNPLFERVVDWRYPDAANCLWNRRLYNNNNTLTFASSVYPYIPADTQNGLQYISMGTAGSSRRLPFSDGNGYNTLSSTPAQLVVMVFGGHNGGGYAMVGTSEGAFGRAAASSTVGITTNTAHNVWKNGEKVDPTTTKFSAGWQVLSVALDGLHFNGLGFTKDLNGERSGQNYGEVLVFTNAVSEQLRLEAEFYLAKKWGLESAYSADAVERLKVLRTAIPVRVSASGAPTIKAGDNAVEVEGPFTGTVNLDGGTLLVPDRPLPFTEADIPSEGRFYWVDPDDDATILRYGEIFSNRPARTNEVRAIRDKVARSFTADELALYGMGNRMPSVVRQSRGIGPERGWLDFNGFAELADGNCLRFMDYPASESDQTSLNTGSSMASLISTVEGRTVFIVQDSVRGGGSPLLDNVNGNGSIRCRREHSWTESMWPNNQPAAFVNGENRLDGIAVDYRNGFHGRPEVFTVRGTAAVNTAVIGTYFSSEGGVEYGEIIGEMLFYSTELSDGVVKGIEAYLMGKWLGRLPDGYADIRKATVTGSGTVNVAVAAQTPRFDSGFEGSVNVADGAFRVIVDPATGEVTGALDCPNAALTLPAACSVTVDFTSRPAHSASGSYTLVRGASGMAGVAWTYTAGANAPSSGVFVNTGSAIVYRFAPRGAVFTFR